MRTRSAACGTSALSDRLGLVLLYIASVTGIATTVRTYVGIMFATKISRRDPQFVNETRCGSARGICFAKKIQNCDETNHGQEPD